MVLKLGSPLHKMGLATYPFIDTLPQNFKYLKTKNTQAKKRLLKGATVMLLNTVETLEMDIFLEEYDSVMEMSVGEFLDSLVKEHKDLYTLLEDHIDYITMEATHERLTLPMKYNEV